MGRDLAAQVRVITPSCSVVVCTRQRATLLERCLTGIAALDHPSYEVIVVDNSEGDVSTVQVAERFNARYVREPQVGASRARNAGARMACGEIVAFTDDDAVPHQSWLRCLADTLEDATLAGATGRIVPLDRSVAAASAYLALAAEDLGRQPLRVDRLSEHWFELANFGGIGLEGNVALRRSLFSNGWGFREDIGLGHGVLGEAHYAFFELLRAGHAIAYVPAAVVQHEAAGDLKAVELRKRRILRSSSAYVVMLLVEEHGYRWRTLRYVVGALRGRRRAWRGVQVGEPFGTRRERLAAGLAGPFIYLSDRLRGGARAPRQLPPPPARRTA